MLYCGNTLINVSDSRNQLLENMQIKPLKIINNQSNLVELPAAAHDNCGCLQVSEGLSTNSLPAPPRRTTFTKFQNEKLLRVVKHCATDSMVNKAKRVKDRCGNDAGEFGISTDSTWQKPGHASLNYFVTAISLVTKKWAVEVVFGKCQGCLNWHMIEMILILKSGKLPISAIVKANHTVWRRLHPQQAGMRWPCAKTSCEPATKSEDFIQRQDTFRRKRLV